VLGDCGLLVVGEWVDFDPATDIDDSVVAHDEGGAFEFRWIAMGSEEWVCLVIVQQHPDHQLDEGRMPEVDTMLTVLKFVEHLLQPGHGNVGPDPALLLTMGLEECHEDGIAILYEDLEFVCRHCGEQLATADTQNGLIGTDWLNEPGNERQRGLQRSVQDAVEDRIPWEQVLLFSFELRSVSSDRTDSSFAALESFSILLCMPSSVQSF